MNSHFNPDVVGWIYILMVFNTVSLMIALCISVKYSIRIRTDIANILKDTVDKRISTALNVERELARAYGNIQGRADQTTERAEAAALIASNSPGNATLVEGTVTTLRPTMP